MHTLASRFRRGSSSRGSRTFELLESLESRVLLSANVISDDFSVAAQRNVTGWMPLLTDGPGKAWALASGDGDYEAQVIATGATPFPGSARFHNVASAAIPLTNNGPYTRSPTMRISGDMAFGAATGQYALLGFYSTLAGAHTYNPAANFTGLKLGVNGTVTLVQNGVSGTAIAWAGSTFNPLVYTHVTYDVNTMTGAISNVAVTGSTATYSFTSTAFTNAATAYAGTGGQGNNSGLTTGSIFVDNLLVQTLDPGGLGDTNPWGIGTSAESSGAYASWMPTMAAAGAKMVRNFPSWGGIETSPGTYNFTTMDNYINTATANNQIISGMFTYSPSWDHPFTVTLDAAVGNAAPSMKFFDSGLSAGSTAISIASAGSYVKPTSITLAADVDLGTYVDTASGHGMMLGFYSSIPTAGNGPLKNFTGLVVNKNGSITLVENGTNKTTINYTGTWSPTTFHTLTYTISTTTGAISGVSFTGSTSSYNWTSTAFTNAATTFAVTGANNTGIDNGPTGRVDNFRVTSGGTTIVRDDFAGTGAIAGRSPNLANLPGGTWQVFSKASGGNVFPSDLTISASTPWSQFVSQTVAHAAGKVRYWEVWNEPEGFAVDGTPAQYANLVVNAYNAAKAADPNAQVGMSVADNDINYIVRAIQAGAADHFDYIAVHPYSIMGAVDHGWEAVYMNIVNVIREAIGAVNPAKANVPVWFTEIAVANGSTVGGRTVDLQIQAQDVVKAYTMGIAQGVSKIEWFEAKNSNYNMGLLNNSGTPNPGYYALQNLVSKLGSYPQYKGWVMLNNQDYGFVFQGASGTVMATWAPLNVTDTVNFGTTVSIYDPVAGTTTSGSTMSLTNAPRLILGVPSALVTQAQNNRNLPLPWGGDYSGATTGTVTAGATNAEAGLHWMFGNLSATWDATYGGGSRYAGTSASQQFTVDPNIISARVPSLTITAVVRRNAAGDNAGFNLKYESTTGWKSIGWNTVPAGASWQTMTWTITDAEFDYIWGYNFRFDSDSTGNAKYYIQSVSIKRNNGVSVNLSGNYNGIGVYSNGTTFSSTGGLTTGKAFSSTLLGSSLTDAATVYNFGAANVNNMVNASGQTITLTGKYNTLTFLAAATGTQSGTFTVTYTDGTSQTFTRTMNDWLSGTAAAGQTLVKTMSYYNTYTGGSTTQNNYLSKYSFQLDPNKTLASITLPNNGNIHLFAMNLLT